MKLITLPSDQTVSPLGKVIVQHTAGGVQVIFTILMEPQGRDAEGWRTGVALDASASMRAWYGRALEGIVPPEVVKDYDTRGWVRMIDQDGRKARSFEREAYDDAIQKGYLKFSVNIVEPLARDFIAYLAGNFDSLGTTSVVYWACGDGRAIEDLGSFNVEQCSLLQVVGPSATTFGQGTCLLPALKQFVEKFVAAKRSMLVFVTDGRIDDLNDVIAYTKSLAQLIDSRARNPVKCVLVGVGSGIDETQMEILDNLDTGTSVDVWDHKIAKEMRGLVEIFAEVVSENRIVAPLASIYDDRGKLIKKFTDGLPARVSLILPLKSKGFMIDVAGQQINQSIDFVVS